MTRSTAIHDRVAEAIARVARVIASGGSKYAALTSQFGARDFAGDAEQQIETMINSLLRRGIDDGTLRRDLTVDELAITLGSLLRAAARMTADHQAGVEKAAALVTSVFLHGTENRHGETTGDRAIRRHPGTGPQPHSNPDDGRSPDKTRA